MTDPFFPRIARTPPPPRTDPSAIPKIPESAKELIEILNARAA
ncbi:MAG: hypothetical protein WCO94_06860 [Verrucomicrobiota bacterium]